MELSIHTSLCIKYVANKILNKTLMDQVLSFSTSQTLKTAKKKDQPLHVFSHVYL